MSTSSPISTLKLPPAAALPAANHLTLTSRPPLPLTIKEDGDGNTVSICLPGVTGDQSASRAVFQARQINEDHLLFHCVDDDLRPHQQAFAKQFIRREGLVEKFEQTDFKSFLKLLLEYGLKPGDKSHLSHVIRSFARNENLHKAIAKANPDLGEEQIANLLKTASIACHRMNDPENNDLLMSLVKFGSGLTGMKKKLDVVRLVDFLK